MAMPRFHTVAAFVVLAVSAAWVLTGEFSSIGSAAQDTSGDEPKVEQPAASPDKVLRTVAVIEPAFIQHNRIIRISGVTTPDKRTTLATRSAGILGELKVKKGDTVQAGDVVLVLDGAEKQAMVDTAKALLDQRQKEAENIERLVRSGISPTTQSDSARSALASARSQLEAAQADIDRLTVVAPFSGIIDQVMVEEGSWLPSGEAAAVLLQLNPVVALGEVSEREIAHVTVGSEADVRLISGDVVSGTVRHVSLEANPCGHDRGNTDQVRGRDGRQAAALGGDAGCGRQSWSQDPQGRQHGGIRANRPDRRFTFGSGLERGSAGRQDHRCRPGSGQ
jgi:membrane fusion protein, multidrug efflux system